MRVAERESLATRLGFILVSAGCAIGLGNVWRFPFITGRYGGAAFVIVYLVFSPIFGFSRDGGSCHGRAAGGTWQGAISLEAEGTKGTSRYIGVVGITYL